MTALDQQTIVAVSRYSVTITSSSSKIIMMELKMQIFHGIHRKELDGNHSNLSDGSQHHAEQQLIMLEGDLHINLYLSRKITASKIYRKCKGITEDLVVTMRPS